MLNKDQLDPQIYLLQGVGFNVVVIAVSYLRWWRSLDLVSGINSHITFWPSFVDEHRALQKTSAKHLMIIIIILWLCLYIFS